MRKIIKEGLDMHFILEPLPCYCKAWDSVPSNKGTEVVLEKGITINSGVHGVQILMANSPKQLSTEI